MKLTTVVQIRPDEPQALLDMMRQFNAACNWLSRVAFKEQLFHWLSLQRRAYHEVRARFGLTGVQATVAVRKAAYVYRNKGRRDRLATFHELGAIPVIRHSYRHDGRVRIYGRLYPFKAVAPLGKRPAQAMLLYRDGRFFINQAVERSTPEPYEPQGFLGCDLGIVNILADSQGESYAGGRLNGLRRRHAKLRGRLQRKGTRSAKRLLRKRRRREFRFARDVNHCISKQVVAKAARHSWGIALEDLKGIQERTVVLRRSQRRQHHAWAFLQLRSFIEYKAALAGAPVALVDPRNTSRTCPECGCIDKRNRSTQALFSCVSCGFAGPADTIAAVIIGSRALGNAPDAAVL